MTPPVPERVAQLAELTIDHGSHSSFDAGHCSTEVVAYLAGEPHTDHPECLSPVLGAFIRTWNDDLDDEGRQKLKSFLPRVIGTAGDGRDEARAWLATDWLVRVHTPAWLELAGVTESAAALRALPPFASPRVARANQSTVEAAARDAARAAVGPAAWAAAEAAARVAAGTAAEAALDPTKQSLQASALGLLERLIDPEAA